MHLLQTTRELECYTLLAVDGEIGRIEALYFDETSRDIRYLLVNSGDWLKGRPLLISPIAVEQIREADNAVHIQLTRKQIQNSPALTTDKIISRQYEAAYFRHYNWPPYWESRQINRAHTPAKRRLHSTQKLKRRAIAARNGEIGRVEDFVIDTQYWVIRYLELDTRQWWPGRQLVINARRMDRPGGEGERYKCS